MSLSRTKGGVELIRIGETNRSEFAAWRFGDELVRRRRWAVIPGIMLGGGVAAALIGSWYLGAAALLGPAAYAFSRQYRTVTRIRSGDREPLEVRSGQLEHAFLFRNPSHEPGESAWGVSVAVRGGRVSFVGTEARAVASRLLRLINRAGARRSTIDDAVRRVDEAGGPEAFVRRVVVEHAAPDPTPEFRLVTWRRLFRTRGRDWSWMGKTVRGSLARMPAVDRIGLEMALQEEDERRSAEGDLRLIERRWKDAETIAGIADGL